MGKFREFVSAKDINNNTGESPSDQVELLSRIVHDNGGRFRLLLKHIIANGELDDDPDLLADIKTLCRSMRTANQHDQYPIRDKRPKGEPDVVSRPKADGGSSPSGPGGGGGEGGGE